MARSRQKKWYVVWHGVEPGVYASWPACQRQVKGFEGALYKSFATEAEARDAYHDTPYAHLRRKAAGQGRPTAKRQPADPPADRHDTVLPLPAAVRADAIAVDAACSGNPGPMEYRGVDLRTGQEVFHYGPVRGTNNIGEFLAIVHALALLERLQSPLAVYSDSRNALLWVEKKACRTKLARTAGTETIFQLIERAENWLRTHTWTTPLLKWDTKAWGEVPADFGRK